MRFKHTLIHFFATLVVICSMIMPAYAEQTMTYLLPANNHRKLTNTRLFFTGKPEITYGTWEHLKKRKGTLRIVDIRLRLPRAPSFIRKHQQRLSIPINVSVRKNFIKTIERQINTLRSIWKVRMETSEKSSCSPKKKEVLTRTSFTLL